MGKQKNYLLLVLKGCAMGAADVVPGVSGGTIAFITGIYEELIDSIKSIDLQALKLLLSLKFADFWKKINGSFLLGVAGGIAISIFSLAKLMTWLLEHHPIYIWSFFFGLIVASSVLVAKEIKHWHIGTVISLIAGGCIAYVITVMSPAETPNTWWFIILSGAIAICAMILPGISGAFILLLMGKYSYILGAVSSLNIGVMLLFIVGAVAGIISFSHLLSWLLKKYHTATVATLTGFMVGSLNKVWPWKETLETYTDSHGVVRPLVEANVSPHYFQELTQSDPLLMEAIVMFCAYLWHRAHRKENAKATVIMQIYGIIGYPLGHSCSPRYFNEKFQKENIAAEYRSFEMPDIRQLPTLLQQTPDLCGFNVTIPHKQNILPFLDEISEEARVIGAVNCVKVSHPNGQPYLVGYNTDMYGFRKALLEFIPAAISKALILGNGGAAKAVRYALHSLNMEVSIVSRTPRQADEIGYAALPDLITGYPLIVNTTPLGTWPDTSEFPPLPYELLTAGHYLFDLVYNPETTTFMQKGRAAGAHACNGYAMWLGQAEKNWEIWKKK